MGTVNDLESGLAQQHASDDAEAKRLRQEEMMRIGAEIEAKEIREMLKTNAHYRREIEIMERELRVMNPEQDRQDIDTLERKLAARKYSLHFAESLLEDIDYSDDDVHENSSTSEPEGKMVCRTVLLSLYVRLFIMYHSSGNQGGAPVSQCISAYTTLYNSTAR